MTRADKTRQAEAEEQAALAVLSTLSLEQANAIDLLVMGQTDGEVAEAVGVTRQTICVWRNHHPAFQAALHTRRQAVWGAAVDRLRGLLPRAVERLEAELDGPNGWKVALRLIEVAGLAQPQGTHLGAYGVGGTDAEDIIDGLARARASPLANLGHVGLTEHMRRVVIVEQADRLRRAEAAQ